MFQAAFYYFETVQTSMAVILSLKMDYGQQGEKIHTIFDWLNHEFYLDYFTFFYNKDAMQTSYGLN